MLCNEIRSLLLMEGPFDGPGPLDNILARSEDRPQADDFESYTKPELLTMMRNAMSRIQSTPPEHFNRAVEDASYRLLEALSNFIRAFPKEGDQ